jgi:hypothetical protein
VSALGPGSESSPIPDPALINGLNRRDCFNNPGIWSFHCHMAWYSEAGLVMQFLSRVDEVANWEIPEANRQLCEVDTAEMEKGACLKDSIWFGFGIDG